MDILKRIFLNSLKHSLSVSILLLTSFSAFSQQTITYQAQNPIANNQIVCASNQYLSCYHLNTKKQLWKNTSINDARGLILYDNKLFLTQDDNIKIFNATNGALLQTLTQAGTLFDPVISAGLLILSSQQGHISVLDAKTNQLIWHKQLDSHWVYPPAISNNTLVTGGQGAVLWSLNIKDGRTLWSKKLTNELVYQPIISNSGIVISTFDGVVRTLDIKTGQNIWQTPLSAALTHIKLNAPNQIIGSSYDGQLYAINTTNGHLNWHVSVANSARFFYSNHLKLTASINYKGLFNLIDNTTGQILQNINLSGQHQVSPLIQRSSIWLFPDKKPAFQLKLNNNNSLIVTKNTLGGN